MSKNIKCGRTCYPKNTEECSRLISDVVNGGVKLKVEIKHESKAWFQQFKLLQRMGGGKSGALVYRSLFVPDKTIVTKAKEAVLGKLWGGHKLQRTLALKLYFDAYDKFGNVNNTRPFREVDAQCRLTGYPGFNCQMCVRTVRWGDVKDRLFRVQSNGKVARKGTSDYVNPEDVIEEERGIFRGKTPNKNDTLEPDIYVMELPYIPKDDDQKVLVMVTDWTPGQPLLSLELWKLERSYLLGLYLELAAVWQRGYKIFREDDHFAHWDLHPDNIFVNLDRDCAPRADVRIPVEAAIKRVKGLMQAFLVASLPPSSREATTQKLKQTLVSTFDVFVERQLGHVVYQSVRSAYGNVTEKAKKVFQAKIDAALVELQKALTAKVDEVVEQNSKEINKLNKMAVQGLKKSALVAIRSVVRYLRRLFRTPDLVLRFPQVTVIDFDLVTSERMFRLEVEHTGKLKSMVPITERAVAFLMRNVPTEIAVAWIRALSSMFRSFTQKTRPYYLVDLNHLITYMFVCGVHYQIPDEMRSEAGSYVFQTLVRVGHSMVESFLSVKDKLREILEDPVALFWKVVDRSIQLQNLRVLTVGREAAKRLSSGLEEATWGALAAAYGVVPLDIETVRSVRNVVFGKQSVRSLISKQVQEALGLDMNAKELLKIFFQNYIYHMNVISWTKFNAFPNQDTLGIEVVPAARSGNAKNNFRDLTMILMPGEKDARQRLDKFLDSLPEIVKSKVDSMSWWKKWLAKKLGTVPLNLSIALSYSKKEPPSFLVSLDGGSEVRMEMQGKIYLKVGKAQLSKEQSDQMHIPSNTLVPLLRSFLYVRGGVHHNNLNKFAVKLDKDNISYESKNEAMFVFFIGNLKLSMPSGGMKLEIDIGVDETQTVDENTRLAFVIEMLTLLEKVLNIDLFYVLGFAKKMSTTILSWLKSKGLLYIFRLFLNKFINPLLNKFINSSEDSESDFAPRTHIELLQTEQKGLYRLVLMTFNQPPHDLAKCVSAISSGNLSDALDCLSYFFPDDGKDLDYGKSYVTQMLVRLLVEELAPWFGSAKFRIVNQTKIEGKKQSVPLADLLQMNVTERIKDTATRNVEFTLLPNMYKDPWMQNDVLMMGITKVLHALRTELQKVQNVSTMQNFVQDQQEVLEKLCPAFVLKLWDTTAIGLEMLWNKVVEVWTLWMESSKEHDVTYLFMDTGHTQRTLQNIMKEACAILLVEVAESAMVQALQYIQDKTKETFKLPTPNWSKLTNAEITRFTQQWAKLKFMVENAQKKPNQIN